MHVAGDSHIAVMIVGEVDGSIPTANAHLDGIMAVVYSLPVVTKHENLPWPSWESPSSEMNIQGFFWAVRSEEAVEGCILKAIEGGYDVLLEGIAVQDKLPVSWVRSQGRDSWFRQHLC
jgi:hypothetical protein